MNRKEVYGMLYEGSSQLYEKKEAEAVAYYLTEFFYGFGRVDLALDGHAEVSKTDNLELLRDEVSRGTPPQYITGRSFFHGNEFIVNGSVLIPRPETEELTSIIIGQSAPGSRILDIGTGSGAIAVTLAKYIENSMVHAVDVSPEALDIARANAAANSVEVDFLEVDILGQRSLMEDVLPPYSFDIIVSNPPYVPYSDLAGMDRNVREFEPHRALFVEDGEPLKFYVSIIRHAQWLMKPGGKLFFEIYHEFAEGVVELMSGFDNVEIIMDMNGKQRFVTGIWNGGSHGEAKQI